MIKNKFLMFWVALSHPFFAQTIYKEAMEEDLRSLSTYCFEIMESSLLQKSEIERELNTIIETLPDSSSTFHFYPFCNKVLSLYDERHLHIQGAKPDPFFIKNISKLRLDTFWYNTRLINGDFYILKNDEYVKVSGFNSLDISTLKRFASSAYINEGNCEIGSLIDMNEQWNYFIQWYFNEPIFFNIELEDGTKLESQGLSLKELQEWYSEKDSTPPSQPIHFSHHPKNKTALLQINTFNPAKYKSQKINYVKWLESTFQYIDTSGVKHLIVDFRNNVGGVNKYADLLLSYLNSFEPKDTLYCIKINNKNHVINPYKVNFKYGKSLYILIGPNTYSNASRIASQLQYLNRGVLIGACSSGKAQNMWAGKYKTKKLKNSKFRAHIPYYQYTYFNYNKLESRCLCPDIQVDEAQNPEKDNTLQAAINIILKKISLNGK